MHVIAAKTCTKCNKERTLEEFVKDRRRSDGHGSWCLSCNRKYMNALLNFDHVCGTKIIQVSNMWSWGRDKVLAEIEKCDLVCANCHRIRTQARRNEDEEQAA